MKDEFYCLALRKKVKTKITAVVKKKGYSLKGVYKEGNKEYNVTKTCSKAKAEEVAEKLGLDIEQQIVEAKASESLETVVPADDFMPEGDGKVIGQNTAGVETAIEGTEDTVTSNTTPLHAESSADGEDKIGPMSMAAEEKSESAPKADEKCGLDYHVRCHKCRLCLDCNLEADAGGNVCRFCTGESLERYDSQNCGCGQDPCVTYGAEEKSAEVGGGGMDYAIEPDHWLRLQAHPEWKGWAPEVNVSREQNYWIINCSQVSADDILELIIATADESLGPMEIPNVNSKALPLGIGLVGLAASLILLRRFSKEE